MSELSEAAKSKSFSWKIPVADTPVVALVLIYAVGVVSISALHGAHLPTFGFYISISIKYAALAVFILGLTFLWRLKRDRPASPIAYLATFARDQRLVERLQLGPTFLLLLAFGALFCTAKAAIPKITPYTLDPALADLDAAALGQDAWRLIHPAVGHPIITFALAYTYQIWAVVLFTVTMVAAFWVEQPKLRLQFLITYLLCWIFLGTIVATLFSSVGPCFYEHFYEDARYAPLMDYLKQVDNSLPLPILGVQDLLLEWSAMAEPQLGSGISAMPSMHISMTVLFALFAWRVSRFWGIAATAFLVAICVESIHSGYHYASDGVVSLVVTPALWWLAGKISNKDSSRGALD